MINIMLRLIAQPSVLSRFSLLFAIGLAVAAITTPAQAQPYPGNAPANSGVPRTEAQGGEVAALQQRLAELGYYSGPVTGYFDPATQAAVTQFQQSNGLAPDGIVGPATSNALYQAGSAAPTNPANSPAFGSESYGYGGDVAGLQQQLSQLGYYTGAASGVLDEQTQTAIMNFQRDRGLTVDGVVGPATQAALSQAPTQPDIAAANPGAQTPAATTADPYTPTATPEDGLLQLGDVGAGVSTLQTQLQALGYYDGPISGSFGDQTQSALIAFQQAQGLTADGIAGPRVSAALGSVTTATAAQPTQTATSTVPQTTIVQPAVQPTAQPAVQPVTQPVATTSQPGTIAVPPINSIQSTQPSFAIVETPAVTPSMPAPLPTQSALPPAANSQMRSSEGGRYSVMELQRRLQLKGFDPIEMNGVYDSFTQNAITQAQQAYGLSQGDLFD